MFAFCSGSDKSRQIESLEAGGQFPSPVNIIHMSEIR